MRGTSSKYTMRYWIWERRKKWILFDSETDRILLMSLDRRIILRTYLVLTNGKQWHELLDKPAV